MPPSKMPPYPYRLGPKNTSFMTTIRRPWALFIFLIGLSFFVHLQMIRHAAKHHKGEECRREPMRSPIDNFQNLNTRPIVNEEFIQNSRIVRSENAIVTSMYNDAFAVPIVTLGESLNRVNSTARRILFYLPGRVSERALCIATSSGFEPYAVERIEPPKDGGVHEHFKDQYTKLSIWRFGELGVKAVVYLDADTLVKRNFDELFLLPFNFAAVPDVYIDDPGFTIAFNAGVLFVRPSTAEFDSLVKKIETAEYPHWEAEQAFLNVYHGPDALRLPYIYNGNMAIKKRNPKLWEGLKSELRLIHFTLVKPFWREVYDDIGIDEMPANVLKRAGDWDGLWREEIMEWGEFWKQTEAKYRYEFTKCGWKHRSHQVSSFP